MQVADVIDQITPIFKNELDNDKVVIKPETTANDIEEWDSLTHIQLVVAIEKHFKIRFTASEIRGFKNVGDMCEGIIKKVQK